MKQRIAVGTDLWLVEGIRRWRLYDFQNQKIFQLTKKCGQTLLELAQDGQSQQKKRIKQFAPDFYQTIQAQNCFDRLFEPSSRLTPNKKNCMLWVEITNSCNQQCVHCYTGSSSHHQNFLAWPVLKSIIQEASRLQFEQIQFTGGEPFLHSQLWNAVRLTRKIGEISVIEIYTNLTALTDQDIKLLKKHQVRIATTLLGSTPRMHDYCTRKKGSFNAFLRNIRKVRDNNIEFKIGVIRLPQNKDDIKSIEQLMRQEQLIDKKEVFSPDDVRPVGRGERQSHLDPKQNQRLYLHINRDFFQMCQHWNSCWGGELAITSSGKVLPCVFARNQVLGNIHSQSLKEIIEGPAQNYWGITADKVEKCKDCEYRYACMDCRVLALQENKCLFGAPVRCSYNPYQ